MNLILKVARLVRLREGFKSINSVYRRRWMQMRNSASFAYAVADGVCLGEREFWRERRNPSLVPK